VPTEVNAEVNADADVETAAAARMPPRAGIGVRAGRLVVALGALLVLAGCAAAPGAGDGPDPLGRFVGTNRLEALPRAEVRFDGSDGEELLRVAAVVADTPAARARGLMGVEAFPDGVGMLFLFPDASGGGSPGFWMLDTLVPLDIAFAAGGVVVGVATMLPCPGPPCPITHPGVDYDVALEVAAGSLAAAGVAPGVRLGWDPVAGDADASDASDAEARDRDGRAG